MGLVKNHFLSITKDHNITLLPYDSILIGCAKDCSGCLVDLAHFVFLFFITSKLHLSGGKIRGAQSTNHACMFFVLFFLFIDEVSGALMRLNIRGAASQAKDVYFLFCHKNITKY